LEQDIDIYFMDIALELAKEAYLKDEVPVGAVLVDHKGNIVGKGYNQPISSLDPSAHAEILALREGAKRINNYRLLDTTLYVTLEPCPMCAGAILYARVKRLVIGTLDPKTGACGSLYNIVSDKRFNHVVQLTYGVRERQCSQILKEFFRQRRHK